MDAAQILPDSLALLGFDVDRGSTDRAHLGVLLLHIPALHYGHAVDGRWKGNHLIYLSFFLTQLSLTKLECDPDEFELIMIEADVANKRLTFICFDPWVDLTLHFQSL